MLVPPGHACVLDLEIGKPIARRGIGVLWIEGFVLDSEIYRLIACLCGERLRGRVIHNACLRWGVNIDEVVSFMIRLVETLDPHLAPCMIQVLDNRLRL